MSEKEVKWQYKIGDFVTPVVQNDFSHATRMVIVGRITEEYAEHVEQSYICAHYRCGDYVRQKLSASELVKAHD